MSILLQRQTVSHYLRALFTIILIATSLMLPKHSAAQAPSLEPSSQAVLSTVVEGSGQATLGAIDKASTALPVRLVIPKLDVDTAIEAVGKTATGAMAVPTQPSDVAWYKHGAEPGESGNAVLAGHLDDIRGAPAVFWRIEELQPEDEVIVIDADGTAHHFQVMAVANYPYLRAPLDRIFGYDFRSNLNLITCGGRWDRTRRTYSERLVVYTRWVESVAPEPASITPSKIQDSNRSRFGL